MFGIGDEIEPADLLDDGAEEEGAGGVAHPGVELAVRLIGAEGGVAEVVACGLGFFGEGDHVGRVGQVPVVVRPEGAGGADAGLDFVDDEEDVVFLGQSAEGAEEGGGGVVVAAFGLDGFDDDGGGGLGPGFDEVFGFFEAALFFGGVVGGVLVQRVFEEGEGRLGPVEGGDVEFVDGLAAGGGEAAEEAAVEGVLEGEDGQVGRAGCLVAHGAREFLGREVDVGSASLVAPLPHECGFVCGFVRVGAGHGGEDLVEPFRGDGQDAGFEDGCPVVLREVSEGWPVYQGGGHFGRGGGKEEGRVRVSDGNGGDLGVADMCSLELV